MRFNEKLKRAMSELKINQTQVSVMTGIGKSSISQYLSGRIEPPDNKKEHIAISLGLEKSFFEKEDGAFADVNEKHAIKKLLPYEAAKLLGMSQDTVRLGLQQGVFPWGYAINTGKSWVYFINAVSFAETEHISLDV